MFYIYHGLMEIPYKDTKTIGVIFPDFLGLLSAGSSYTEAKEKAIEGLQSHIEAMIRNRDKIPEPTTLNIIMEDKEILEKISNNEVCVFSVGVYISIKVT